MTTFEIVRKFVDVAIDALNNGDYDPFYLDYVEIPENMVDTKKPEKGGVHAWKPIDSLISDEKLVELEENIAYKLPPSYKSFLQYKHFYQLASWTKVSFPRVPSNSWFEELEDLFFDAGGEEDLLDKGYIAFAKYAPESIVCFNVNEADEDGEYQVVLWNEEEPDEHEELAENFEELLNKILKKKK